jgi:hypothetical protein
VASDTQFLAISDLIKSGGVNNLNIGWFAADQNPYGSALAGESAVVRLLNDNLTDTFAHPSFPEALPAGDGSFLIVPSYPTVSRHAQARITLPLAKGSDVIFAVPSGTSGRYGVPEVLLKDRLLYQFGGNVVATTSPLQLDRFAGTTGAVVDAPAPPLPNGLRTAHAQGVFATGPGGLVIWLVPNADVPGGSNTSLTQVREARLFWVAEGAAENPTLNNSTVLRSYIADGGGIVARDASLDGAPAGSTYVERATGALASVDRDRSVVVLRGADGGAEVDVYSRDAGMLPAYHKNLDVPLNPAPLNAPSGVAVLNSNAHAWASKGRVVLAMEDLGKKQIVVSVLEPTCDP